MPSLKAAVLRLCTLGIPWPTTAAATMGCAEVSGARIYLANLAKDRVVVRVGHDLWQAGDQQAITSLRTRKTTARFGGNSAAYRRARRVWDELESLHNAAGSAGNLTSHKRARPSITDETEQDLATGDDMAVELVPMVSPAAAAQTLGVSTFTIIRQLKRGTVKGARKVGRQWRIPVTVVMDIGK